MRIRIGFVPVVMLLTVCVSEVRSQTGPYIQMDLGMTVAPPLTVQGADNDGGTKCDLIINPLGVGAGGECDVAPPLTSWTPHVGAGFGVARLRVGVETER